MSNIPITAGSGSASVATEQIGTLNYQQIKVVDGTAGSTNKWIINLDGSAQVSVVGNHSVSGTLGASIIGSVPVQLGNSSVVTVIQGSIAAAIVSGSITVAAPANQSVSGTVGASIIGAVPIQPSNSSIITVWQNSSVIAVPTGNQSVSGTLITIAQGSVAAVIIGGSITATFSGTANQSVSGSVNISGPVSVIGTYSDSTVASTVQGIPFMFKANISSSVMQAVSPTFPLPVTITGTPPAQSVSGTVGASIVGQLPAGTAMLGSVAALQGTNPWIVTSSVAGGLFPISGSVAATITNTNINVSGSVVAFQGAGWSGSVAAFVVGNASVITLAQANSIVGTYLEDNAHTSGDRGVFTLNVRNDTLASVTSNDGDYGALSIGPSGEGIVANAPLTKWVQGTADFRGNAGASIQVIGAGGTSVFTYVTSWQVANMGSASVLISFLTSSVGGAPTFLGYTIAPAGGGSNIFMANGVKTITNGNVSGSISGVASVFISAQGFISKS